MRINTQFPVAVHILAVLAYFRDGPPPSEIIASSVGTNPVVVRRILALLRKSRLVETQSGVKGAVLLRDPANISLLDIYMAVRGDNDVLFDTHTTPHPDCPVGGHFLDAVATPLRNAQQALEQKLAAVSLADVVRTIRHANA